MTGIYRQVSNYLDGVEAIVFDWDDTLVNTREGKLLQNKSLANHFGVERSMSEVEALYDSGMSLPEMLTELCQHDDFDEIWSVAKTSYHDPEYAKRTIEGAEQSVRTLRDLGYRTALFTAVSPEALRSDMERPGFDRKVFSGPLMHVPYGTPKSDARAFTPVLKWLRDTGIEPRNTLYVGDGLGDMMGALEAGLRFIGVEQGSISREIFSEHGVLSLPGVQTLATIAASRHRYPKSSNR